MVFNFIESLKNPAQQRGLVPELVPKEEFEISTWLIVLVIVVFVSVVGWLFFH